MLEAWKGKADDGDKELTLDELVTYTRKETQTFARLNLETVQSPELKGNFSGTWVLARIGATTPPTARSNKPNRPEMRKDAGSAPATESEPSPDQGGINVALAEKELAEIELLSNRLKAGAGNALRGQEFFSKHCAGCHQMVGKGNKIGPDLAEVSREVFVAGLFEPSARIRKEFLTYELRTASGRTVTGILADETPEAVTLVDAKNKKTTVPRSDIEEMAQTERSLMPGGFLGMLNPPDIADIFAFLRSVANNRAAGETRFDN